MASITAAAGHVAAEPAVGVSAGGGTCKVDGLPHVLECTKFPVCVWCLQDMCPLEGGASAICVQHHIACLHALTIAACRNGLIEAHELEASFVMSQSLTCHPTASSCQPTLFCCHGYVVQHVVDGAKEWRDLQEESETVMMTQTI